MKIEENQKSFLEELLSLDVLRVSKTVNELIDDYPNFLSDYLSMFFFRKSNFNFQLECLFRDYGMGRKYSHQIIRPTLKERDVHYMVEEKFRDKTINEVCLKAEEKAKKYFSKNKEKRHYHLLDLARRLWTKQGCPIWKECPGLPDANFGIGGCEGYVWCSVYNLGGSHGSIDDQKLRKKGYKYPSDIPQKLRKKLTLSYLKQYLENHSKK